MIMTPLDIRLDRRFRRQEEGILLPRQLFLRVGGGGRVRRLQELPQAGKDSYI